MGVAAGGGVAECGGVASGSPGSEIFRYNLTSLPHDMREIHQYYAAEIVITFMYAEIHLYGVRVPDSVRRVSGKSSITRVEHAMLLSSWR
eukprot:5051694-Pyramimonas_sp.AAC.1